MLKQLATARVDYSFDRELHRFLAPDVLLADDFGLHKLSAQQSSDFYDVIIGRHRTSSLVVTSNRDVSEWLALFDDPILANSALDRLLSRIRDNRRYPEVRIIARSRPTDVGGDLRLRDNQAPARKRIRASGARYRPGMDEGGVSLDKAFSFMDMSACR
jgi:hypothetical protein